jgi:serine/threonine protein kinase
VAPYFGSPVAVMDPFSPDHLFQSIRESGQFPAEKLAILDAIPAEAKSDPVSLADRLWSARLLTAYQTRKVRLNRLSEILFGDYLVLDKIGEGGMGKVFKAIQCRTGKLVALKVVRAHLMANKTVVGRYKREAAAAAKLKHPNIVSLLDADEAQGRYFLAMEFVYGSDLSRMVKEFGPLPFPEAAEYIRQGALGLQHAHDHDLIHRDIKPSNMLVSGERALPGTDGVAVVRILDMGLVRSLIEDDDAAKTELTRDGTVVGTPDYMAPEQAKNSSTVDRRADLYSLGCTLYYLLSGKPPFPDGTPIDKLLRHQLDPPPEIRKQRPDVPDAMMRTMLKMMAKRPEDRIPSAGEVATILAQFTSEGLANVPEIVLTMPDHVPGPSGAVVPSGDTAPAAAVQVLEAEIVTRKPATAPKTATTTPKKSVKLVPRESDSNDAVPVSPISTRRRDSRDSSVEGTRSMPDSSDDTRVRARDTEASVARQKRMAKSRLGQKKRKTGPNWVAIGLGVAGVAILAFVGWQVFKPKGDAKPLATETKPSEPPPRVAATGLPPAWTNLPENTAAAIVVHPEAFWQTARDRIGPNARIVKAMNHLATQYRFDVRAGERYTVAFGPGRTTAFAATVEGAFLDEAWRSENDKWPGVKVEKMATGRRLRFGSESSKTVGLLGGDRRGYTIANEESFLLDLSSRGPSSKPTLPAELIAALPDPADPNRPAFTFVATGDWHLPDGLSLSELGVERLIIHARQVDDKFQVDLEIVGRSKSGISDFVNLKLWGAVNAQYPGMKPFLQAVLLNTANDGWDTVGPLHRLKKAESDIWEVSAILGWIEKLLPN